MSAFLLISATAPKKQLPRSRSHPKSLNGNHIPRSTNSSVKAAPSFSGYSLDAKSVSESSVRSSAGASSKSGSSRSTGSKQYFDPQTLKYVDCEATLTLFEKKLHEFSEAVLTVKIRSIGMPSLRLLNDTMRSEASGTTGQLLLTTSSIEHLRYNYFEQFQPDDLKIRNQIAMQKPAYTVILAADTKIDAGVLEESYPRQAAQRVPSSFTMSKSSLAADTLRAKLSALEDRLTCPTPPSIGHTSGIRDALQLQSFWEDVYQDIRGEDYEEEYFEWLPSRQMTQRFFVEITDFALYRIREVTCNVSASEAPMLNEDEKNELARNHFFYFQKWDTALIEYMSMFVMSQFFTPIKTRVLTAGPEHLRELMVVLIRAVGDNLKVHFYGYSKAETTTDLFCEFVLCILDAIVLDISKVVATQENENVSPVSSMGSLMGSSFERSPTNNTSDGNYTVSPLSSTKKHSTSERESKPLKTKKSFFGRFRS